MISRPILTIIGLLYLCGVVTAQPDTTITLFIQAGSKLWFEGTSTLHDFACTTSTIQGAIGVDTVQLVEGFSNETPFFSKVKIMIPVQSITSGNGSLDENMYEALKAEEHPYIKFFLLEALKISESKKEKDGFEIETKGSLTVAGKEQVIDMTVLLAKKNDGSINVRGTKDLFMTDFDVEPPSFMLGVLKTGNKVVVHFDLMLSKRNQIQ